MKMEARTIQVGYRFGLPHFVDRLPDFVAQAGNTGTVVSVTDNEIWARMDQRIKGAEEWENCIQWFDYPDSTAVEQFLADTEALSEAAAI